MALRETVAQAAERLYPGMTYDCALPQEWVDAGRCHAIGHVIWGYPKGSIFGMPMAITEHGKKLLESI